MVTDVRPASRLRGPTAPSVTTDEMVDGGSFKCVGDPNGKIAAPIGKTCVDTATGEQWVKLADDGLDTGWTLERHANADVLATGTEVQRPLSDRFAEVINILDFGADPLGLVDSTLAIQRAIDLAIDTKTSVWCPPGVYLLSSWSDTTPWVLLCGYSAINGTSGLKSATEQVSPRQDLINFNGLLIYGPDTGKRLNRIDTNPNETYTKGTVFKFTGSMAGKIGIMTGYLQRNIRIRNITFIGQGYTEDSIAARHNVSSSHFELDNCSFWHWGTAISIGGDYADAGNSDQHADFNTLNRVSVNQCKIGVDVANLNAYVTTATNCEISALIPFRNQRSMLGGTSAPTNSPRVNVFGGFVAPLFECGGVLLEGTVTSVSGQDVVVDITTKITKVRNAGFSAVSLLSQSGSISDVGTDMLVLIDSNCNAIGDARVDELGVMNEITAIDTGTGTLTLSGLVRTDLAGKTIRVTRAAIGFLGDHFNVDGTHGEQANSEDVGIGPMICQLVGWKSNSSFANMVWNLFPTESEYNRRLPKVFVRNLFPTLHGFGFTLEKNTFNSPIFKMQVDSGTSSMRSRQNNYYGDPLVLDHNGTPADGFVQDGDAVFFKFGMTTVPPGNESLAIVHQQGPGVFETIGGIRRRRVTIVTSAPTRGNSGDCFLLDSTEPVLYRIDGTSGAQGYYDPTAITLTADTVAGSAEVTVSSLLGLDIGRVVKIAGAGTETAPSSGVYNDLTARIVYLKYDGATRKIWLATAATPTTTGSSVTAPTVPVTANLKVGDPASSDPQLIVQGSASAGDVIEFRRTSGITQSHGIAVLDAVLRIKDRTHSRNIVDLTSASAAISMKPFGGILFPTIANDPSLSELSTGVAAYRKNNKFVLSYSSGGVQYFWKLPCDGVTAVATVDTTPP